MTHHIPIGKLVFYWRTRRGYSRAQFAILIGISRPAVVQWETLKTNPSEKNLHVVCTVLGLTREQFFRAERTITKNSQAACE